MTLWCLWSHFNLSLLINDQSVPGVFISFYISIRETVDVYDVYCPGSPTIKHLKNLEFVPRSSFIFCNDYIAAFLICSIKLLVISFMTLTKNNKPSKSKLICIDKEFKISIFKLPLMLGFFPGQEKTNESHEFLRDLEDTFSSCDSSNVE